MVVDAEVVDEPAVAPAPEPVSTELVRRERRSEVLRPLDPEMLLQSFEEYQGLLQRLLTSEDWQGKPNAQGSFVKKKGWRKIATAFDLDVTVIPGMSKIERDENGLPVRAEVWMRAMAPSGRTMDGDGYCSVTEPRFSQAAGRQKLENDLRATATTRAKNRAISDLIGMGDVSAEEVDATPAAPEPGLPFGIPAADSFLKQTRAAIAFLFTSDEETCEPDDTRVTAALTRALDLLGKQGLGGDPYVPFATAVGICAVATELKVSYEASHSASEPTPPAAVMTVPNIAGMSGEAGTDALKAAGCTCPDPLGVESGTVVFDDDCPIPGHSIPF
jgi:hypothetical protein